LNFGHMRFSIVGFFFSLLACLFSFKVFNGFFLDVFLWFLPLVLVFPFSAYHIGR
jgi:hypothetical protein